MPHVLSGSTRKARTKGGADQGGTRSEPAPETIGRRTRVQAELGGTPGGGEPLPSQERRKFEASLGADLGGVRVHTGEPAARSARALGAKAYTVGEHIHFGTGQYQLGSSDGERLLAHEVAHTVQQRGGAAAVQTKLEVSTPGDASEREADEAAASMIAGSPARVTPADARVMREPDPDAAPGPAAPGPDPSGTAAPATGGVQVGALFQVTCKTSKEKVPIDGTPLAFTYEVSAEGKYQVTSVDPGGAGPAAQITGGRAVEISPDGIKEVSQVQGTQDMDLWGLKCLGISKLKGSKDGIQLDLGFQKNGQLLGHTFQATIVGGVSIGKNNEFKVVGIDFGFPLQASPEPLSAPGVKGTFTLTTAKGSGALVADAVSVIRWLIEQGALDVSEGALPILLDGAGMIGSIAAIAYGTYEVFKEIEQLEEPIVHMAQDAAFATRRYGAMLTGQHQPETPSEQAVFARGQTELARVAGALGLAKDDLVKSLRQHPAKLEPLCTAANTSAKNECFTKAKQMVDRYWDNLNWFERTFSIKDKPWLYDNASTWVERNFAMIAAN